MLHGSLVDKETGSQSNSQPPATDNTIVSIMRPELIIAKFKENDPVLLLTYRYSLVLTQLLGNARLKYWLTSVTSRVLRSQTTCRIDTCLDPIL